MAEAVEALTCGDCEGWCGRCSDAPKGSKLRFTRIASSEACDNVRPRKIKEKT
jgi:hypothetical protein